MRREIIETGKTAEDAINAACDKLGLSRDDVEWEILDLPKTSFLGIKKTPARVKVWKDEPDIPDKQPLPKLAPQPSAPERPVAPAKPAAVGAEEKAPAKPVSHPDAPRLVSAGRPAAVYAPEARTVEMSEEVARKIALAEEYLTNICAEMGMKPTFLSEIRDGGIFVNVQGEGLGAMIGRRGETLDALQYLAGLVANRLDGEYLRFTLDCGDYRTKRKSTLEALARKLCAQVVKTNTSKTLEPMNPFERRIIHATVSEIAGVTSTSVGEEPNRKVVISTLASKPRATAMSSRTSGDRDRSYRPRRGGRPNREVRESTQGGTINTLPQNYAQPYRAPTASRPENEASANPEALQPKPVLPSEPVQNQPQTVHEAGDKPLYAKLDLE